MREDISARRTPFPLYNFNFAHRSRARGPSVYDLHVRDRNFQRVVYRKHSRGLTATEISFGLVFWYSQRDVGDLRRRPRLSISLSLSFFPSSRLFPFPLGLSRTPSPFSLHSLDSSSYLLPANPTTPPFSAYVNGTAL